MKVRFFSSYPAVRWAAVAAAVAMELSYPPPAAAQTGLSRPPQPPGGVYIYDGKMRIAPKMAVELICIVSAVFALACVFVYIRQRFERRRARDFVLDAAAGRRRAAVCGLDRDEIEALPTFVYSEVRGLKIGKGSLECAVCLNEFEDDETLRLLPGCSHVFHQSCIDAWLSSHATCPVCRANLESKSDNTRFATLLTPDPELSSDGYDHYVNLNHRNDDLIEQGQSPEVINTIQTPNRNFPIQSTPEKGLPSGNLPRSHTTGHSLVPPGENYDRFTLRLPEDVRNRLLNMGLSRARSCVAFPRARSSKKGYRSSSGGTGRRKNYFYERYDRDGRSDRWGFILTPPFFSRAGSARSSKAAVGGGGVGEEASASSKPVLKSVTSWRRLFAGTDMEKQGVNVGERSSDRLSMASQV